MSAIHDVVTGPKLRQELVEQLLAELQHLNSTQTEMMARLRGGLILNNVLAVEQAVIPAAGWIQRDYPTAIGSLIVINYSAATMTVTSGGAASTAPTAGSGVQTIPAQSYLAVPVGSTTFTVYGTPGSLLNIQVFTGMAAFGGGAL